MATASATYPRLGMTAWRTLRVRAAQAPSQKFTPTTVATLLGYDSSKSAANNVVYPMQMLGLIDENGTLTDRGNKWRNDDSYAVACQEILDEIYPPELAGFTTADGGPDRAMVTKWFQHKNFGEANATKMAITYVMIAEKKVPDTAIDKEPKAKTKPTAGTAARTSKPTSTEAVTPASPPPAAHPVARPAIHLDFQIHIAADTKPEVVDQIFASMAKHLYGPA